MERRDCRRGGREDGCRGDPDWTVPGAEARVAELARPVEPGRGRPKRPTHAQDKEEEEEEAIARRRGEQRRAERRC